MTCPECGAVSKAAADTVYGGKYYCDGPRGEMHRRAQMKPIKFRELRART